MQILEATVEAVIAHAAESLPHECCGILLTDPDRPEVVSHMLRGRNAERTNPGGAFVLGHAAHLDAVAREAAGQVRIAGYYHSHPHGPASPSRRDRELGVAGTTYLIIAFGGGKPKMTAWRVQGDKWTAEPLEVRTSNGSQDRIETPESQPGTATL